MSALRARAEEYLAMRRALGFKLTTQGWHHDELRAYCKDANRQGSYEHTSFTFPGCTFRPRPAISRAGRHFVSFLPAASKEAIKAMGKRVRSWQLANRSDKSLTDLARMFNSIVQGRINYYGSFYRSGLYPLLRRINDYPVRWACRKYKRLRRRKKRARELLAGVARRHPNLFAHWRFGLKPGGWTVGAV